MAQQRGTYQFEVDSAGRLVDNVTNLEKLRTLFLDGSIIGNDWGPGNPGDFDHGSWHILCHLAGASIVFDGPQGFAWCGVTHVAVSDTYATTLTFRDGVVVRTYSLDSPQAAAFIAQSSCVGFIEGSSLGHICARGVNDPPNAFNRWPRQLFDQDITSNADGGTVWEQWSTTRDLRESSVIGTAVLQAWLSMVALAGGNFVAAVARGRREHSHPQQLVALVRAGLLTSAEAMVDLTPLPISTAAEKLLYEARAVDALTAAQQLGFTKNQVRYFMFSRRIQRWSSAAQVKSDLSL